VDGEGDEDVIAQVVDIDMATVGVELDVCRLRVPFFRTLEKKRQNSYSQFSTTIIL
jgi:hypothetical protein